MSESILQPTVAQEENHHEKVRLHTENADLIKIGAETEVKYEQRRQTLLVAEANLMSLQETRDLIQFSTYVESYNLVYRKEKVRLILKAHKRKSLQLVNESLEKGWKIWSA